MYSEKRTTTSRTNSNNNRSRKSKASKQDKTYEGYYYDDYYEAADSDRRPNTSHRHSGNLGYGSKEQEADFKHNNNEEEDSGYYVEDGDSAAGSHTAFGCGEFEDPFTGEMRLNSTDFLFNS